MLAVSLVLVIYCSHLLERLSQIWKRKKRGREPLVVKTNFPSRTILQHETVQKKIKKWSCGIQQQIMQDLEITVPTITDKVLQLWKRMDEGSTFGKMAREGMVKIIKAQTDGKALPPIGTQGMDMEDLDERHLWEDICSYLDSCIVGDIEKDDMTLLRELKQETEEGNLVFLQRFYQGYLAISHLITEANAVRVLWRS